MSEAQPQDNDPKANEPKGNDPKSNEPKGNKRFWVFITLLVVGIVTACTLMVTVGNHLKPVAAEATLKRVDAALEKQKLTDDDRAMIRTQLERLVAAFVADDLSYPPVSAYLEEFGKSDMMRIGWLRQWQQLVREADGLDESLRARALAGVDGYIAATMRDEEDEAPGSALCLAWAEHGDAQATSEAFVGEQAAAFAGYAAQRADDPMSFEAYVRAQIDAVLAAHR